LGHRVFSDYISCINVERLKKHTHTELNTDRFWVEVKDVSKQTKDLDETVNVAHAMVACRECEGKTESILRHEWYVQMRKLLSLIIAFTKGENSSSTHWIRTWMYSRCRTKDIPLHLVQTKLQFFPLSK
jgi:hypothetical protein